MKCKSVQDDSVWMHLLSQPILYEMTHTGTQSAGALRAHKPLPQRLMVCFSPFRQQWSSFDSNLVTSRERCLGFTGCWLFTLCLLFSKLLPCTQPGQTSCCKELISAVVPSATFLIYHKCKVKTECDSWREKCVSLAVLRLPMWSFINYVRWKTFLRYPFPPVWTRCWLMLQSWFNFGSFNHWFTFPCTQRNLLISLRLLQCFLYSTLNICRGLWCPKDIDNSVYLVFPQKQYHRVNNSWHLWILGAMMTCIPICRLVFIITHTGFIWEMLFI